MFGTFTCQHQQHECGDQLSGQSVIHTLPADPGKEVGREGGQDKEELCHGDRHHSVHG